VATASSGGHFIHYDLEEDNLPDTIKGTVELAIVDPPFLNEGSTEDVFVISTTYESICRSRTVI
jgi:Probable N6-adenine methyltransferase